MILPDDTPDSPKAQQALVDRNAHVEGDSSHQLLLPPPPAYSGPPETGYGSYERGHYPILSSSPLLLPEGALHRPQSAGRRFIEAAAVAILLWTLFAVLMKSVLEVGRFQGHRGGRIIDIDVQSPAPDVRCIGPMGEWAFDGSTARTSFRLPLSTEVLYFLSKGSDISGGIDFRPEDEPSLYSTSITVDVTVKSSFAGLAHACEVERGNNQRGISFFTSLNSRGPEPPRQHTELHVVVRFPRIYGARLQLQGLETDLKNWAHHIGDLQETVEFRRISFITSNSAITSQSFHADRVDIQTSNSLIQGRFEARESLRLITTNSPIVANVSLFHDDVRPPVELVLQTSNGAIQSSVSLISTAPNDARGSFQVSAATSNSALDLSVDAQPLDSHLALSAKTSNSPATVGLPRAYEGAFVLEQSAKRPVILFANGQPDPAGKERRRRIVKKATKVGMNGTVVWDEGNEDSGMVYVKSAAPLTLLLT